MNQICISNSGDGWRNLGVDEYFLDHVGPQDMLLYFYVNRGAVIIGRGQNPWAECDLAAMKRDGVQLVRRVSGGGAVFHDDGNLNFSFIAGEARYDVHRQLNLILNAVRALGVDCEFSGRNDLLACGRKFSGNAFCARKGVRQHHGTLLIDSDLARLNDYLNVDVRKLQAKGVKSVRSRVCNLREFAPDLSIGRMLEALKDAYRAQYGEFCELDPPTGGEVERYVQKHASDAWRLGETPRFDAAVEHRFAWGGIQLLLTLCKGKIEDLKVYTDALDVQLPDEIRARLIGAVYDGAAMADRLAGSEKRELSELSQLLRASNDGN